MISGLASRLVVGLEGPWPTAYEAAWLKQHQPAGVILFARNVRYCNSLRKLCEVLHQLVPGLEIMADHEGGPVSHLSGALGRPPAAWSLGALDDLGLTAEVFEETGVRLSEVGIDRVLSPVADVLTEPRNPVIGVRAFGSDTALVTRHTVAAVSGLLSAGVDVCLKHWPGHGGSTGDSHLAETEVSDGGIPTPFLAGLTAGAGAVMVGHLLLAGDTEENDSVPATLNSEFMSATRKELGSGDGDDLLFFADDVTMGALGPAMKRLGVPVPAPQASGLFDPADLPGAWFEQFVIAGCDRLLIRGIPSGAFPLEGEPAELSAPDEDVDGQFSFSSSVGIYAEARQLLWAAAGKDFAQAESDLLWLDFSRGDRWEAAADPGTPGGEGGVLGLIRTRLALLFRSVCLDTGDCGPGNAWNRVLVSSHRSLTGGQVKLENLAPVGMCLVMGHPSLKNDMEGLLGPDWTVRALFDITPEDLPEPGTNI